MTAPRLQKFVFNPFQENTYILTAENNECIIIDPGCMDAVECASLSAFITEHQLTPKRILLTHAHIDHILGLAYVQDTYDIEAECHPAEIENFNSGALISDTYGIPYHQGRDPLMTLSHGMQIEFHEYRLDCILAPGHSPGSICFYMEDQQSLIGGDVLFHESIGRTDLPGGDHDQLLNSIQQRIYTLPDETKVYSGHGMETEIGYEKDNNMFVRGLG